MKKIILLKKENIIKFFDEAYMKENNKKMFIVIHLYVKFIYLLIYKNLIMN